MTDFLGSLVQRALPTIARSAGTELAPRLPGLFEPTGAEVTAPIPTSTLQESPDSHLSQHPDLQNNQGPHPTVVAPMKTAMPSSPPAFPPETLSQSMPTPKQADESDGPITEAPIHPTVERSPMLHPERKQSLIQNKQPTAPVPAARLVPAPQTSSLTTQQSNRVENTAAMIAESPQTTVRINIGRIEVRAVHVPQSAPPARKTAQPSKLTLEEYAKQRSEGKV